MGKLYILGGEIPSSKEKLGKELTFDGVPALHCSDP